MNQNPSNLFRTRGISAIIIIILVVSLLIIGGVLFWHFGKVQPTETEVPKETLPEREQAPSSIDVERNPIWIVEGRENKVYLLGSFHLLRERDYPLPSAIEKIYDCCQKLIFETDIGMLEDPVFLNKMMEKMFYPPGAALSKNLSKDTLNLLKQKLSFHELSIENFEEMKPWAVALTITVLELGRLGYDPELGIDDYFYKKAKLDNKKIGYLETPEFQIDLMANLEKIEQEFLLRQTLKEMETLEVEASKLIEAWRKGDSDEMERIIQLDFEGFPELYDLFFVQRNKKWMALIEAFLNEKEDVLVIVGVGHLMGKDSLINLLEVKNYKIKQK